MRPSIEESGPTSEAAIEKALDKLKLPRDRVIVEILSQYHNQPRETARVKITPLGETPVPLHASTILHEILDRMGIGADISLEIEDKTIYLDIHSEYSGLIIGKKGTTIDALQHVTNRIFGQAYHGNWKVVIDIQGYRDRKENELIRTARQFADEAKGKGEPVETPPFSPQDRRIIHMALQEDPKVTTESQGNSFMKSIVVSPA